MTLNSPKNSRGASPRELNKFKLLKRIGAGAYGVVLSGKEPNSNNEVAIKCIEDPFSDPKETYRALLEVKLLKHFRNSKYIVNMKEVLLPTSEDNFRNVYIVCELMEKNLEEALQRSRFSVEQCKNTMAQLLLGLSQIHRAKIIHRDLRPKNILLKGESTKICDFGLGRNLEGLQGDSLRLSLLSFISVRCYRAPEGFGGSNNYTTAVDIWALGCIFAELLSNSFGRYKPLISGSNDEDYLKKIVEFNGKPSTEELQTVISDPKIRGFVSSIETTHPDSKTAFRSLFPEASQETISLLSQLLAFDPNKRLSAVQALKHPYFQSMREMINKELKQIEENQTTFTLPSSFPSPNTATVQEIKAELYKEIVANQFKTIPNR